MGFRRFATMAIAPGAILTAFEMLAPAAPAVATKQLTLPPVAAPLVVASPVPVAPPPVDAAPAPTPPPAGTAIKRVLDTGGPIRFGHWFWDEEGVPAGPVVITVDLDAQVISIFRAGYEIGTAAMIYGEDDKPTPLGVFPITQKDAKHVSNLYHVPMPYMQRLTNDGISIHAAPVVMDTATHGCIGVPLEFARLLFGATKLGDRVIITNGQRLSVGEEAGAG